MFYPDFISHAVCLGLVAYFVITIHSFCSDEVLAMVVILVSCHFDSGSCFSKPSELQTGNSVQ